jgi:hypothetical protein
MKILNSQFSILNLFFLAAITACNEDLGNYDYKEINSVQIKDVDNDNGINNRTADIGSILKITPILEFSRTGDESLFTYAWYYHAGGEWKLLQEGRNLEIEVADPIGTPDKTYTLAYEALNTATNIPYRKLFTLKVNNILTRGFLALCEHEDGFDIDQIALSGEWRFDLYKNVLEMSGSDLPRQGVTPYDVLCFDDVMAPDPYNRTGVAYSVYVLTDQYTTRILASDYSWKPAYDITNSVESNSYLDKEYVKKGKPIVCRKMKVGYINIAQGGRHSRTMFYHQEEDGQGNWYACSRYPSWIFYSCPMNDIRPAGGSRYEPAPYACIGSFGAMYFDAGSKAFKYQSFSVNDYGVSGYWYTSPLPEDEADNGTFNFKDPNEGLLYMDEQKVTWGNTLSASWYAILKQSNGSFKYIEFGDRATNMASLDNLVSADRKKRGSVFPAGSRIGDARFFARAPQSNTPFLYYATNDNRVYKADISGASAVFEEITSSILSGDGYSEITAFKYLLPNADDIGSPGRALAVATYNPTLGKDAGGKLEFFRIEDSATGELVLAGYPETAGEGDYQIDMSWRGLGKIVGLSYKQK